MKQIHKFWILLIVSICKAYDPQKNRILCIVNFNFPHYDNIEMIQDFYGTFFPHMVFYGPEPHERVHVMQHAGDIGVHPYLPRMIGGYYGYKDIADAMRRYPDYDGYLFTNDDCFMNIKKFQRLDCNKIWFIPLHRIKKFEKQDVWFWNTFGGFSAIAKCYEKLPQKYQSVLYKNISEVESCWAMSDLVYFPAKYKEDIIFLCNFFSKKGLWLEIAIPHLCACVEMEHNFEILKALYAGRYIEDTLKLYNETFDFVHPIKLSNPLAVSFVREQLKKSQMRELELLFSQGSILVSF